MTNATVEIAAKVRGVAAEQRLTQQRIADVLDVNRSTIVDRMSGKYPFTATEIFTLASAFNVPVSRFFPEPASERVAP